MPTNEVRIVIDLEDIKDQLRPVIDSIQETYSSFLEDIGGTVEQWNTKIDESREQIQEIINNHNDNLASQRLAIEETFKQQRQAAQTELATFQTTVQDKIQESQTQMIAKLTQFTDNLNQNLHEQSTQFAKGLQSSVESIVQDKLTKFQHSMETAYKNELNQVNDKIQAVQGNVTQLCNEVANIKLSIENLLPCEQRNSRIQRRFGD